MAGPRGVKREVNPGVVASVELFAKVDWGMSPATEVAVPLAAKACSMAGLRSGKAAATALNISLPLPGTAWATATAMLRYSFGTARQTATTIAPAFEGAAAAAALAITL